MVQMFVCQLKCIWLELVWGNFHDLSHNSSVIGGTFNGCHLLTLPPSMEAIMTQTANDVLTQLHVDHKHEPVNLHTPPGIYATSDFHWAAIKALADYIDGKRTDVKVTEARVSTATAGQFVASDPVYSE